MGKTSRTWTYSSGAGLSLSKVFFCSSAAAFVARGQRPLLFFVVGRYLPILVDNSAIRARACRIMAQVLSKRNDFFKRRRTLGSRCSFVERGKKCCDPETKDRIIPLWFCTYTYTYTGCIMNIYLCGARKVYKTFCCRPCAVLMGWDHEG